MNNYKILSFDETSGQLIMEFAVGIPPFSIDVPIKDGVYITGAELEEYINGFIPAWHIERVAQINAGIPNVAEIKAFAESKGLVEIPSALTPQQQIDIETAKMWEKIKFERDVAAALIKFGVLTEDPMEIPVEQVG